MRQEILICNMQSDDIENAIKTMECPVFMSTANNKDIPQYWSTNTKEIRTMLESQIQKNNAFIAKKKRTDCRLLELF